MKRVSQDSRIDACEIATLDASQGKCLKFSGRAMGMAPTTSDEEKRLLSDQVFVAVFYGCIGFLSTFVGMFGRHAFQVPFIILSFLVCLRFALRARCRTAMLEQLKSKQSLLILVFAAAVSGYAIVGAAFDAERTRLLGKPAIILLALMVFAYIWGHRACFDKERIHRGLLYGMIGGLVGVTAVSAWNWLAITNFHRQGGVQISAIPISIYALNDELKILSVLTFFTAAGMANKGKWLISCVVFPVVILLLSCWTYGTYKGTGAGVFVSHTPSDVVQFGLPLVIALFLVAALAPKLMTNLVFLGIGTVLLFTPWIFQIWYQVAEGLALPRASTFLVRAEIWDKIAQLSLQKPFFGYGLDATRYMGTIDFAQKYYKGDELAHPHNMFVQTWMDMGLVGVVFVLLFCYFAWQKVQKLPETIQPAIIAGISMYVLFAFATHSIWQTWNLVLLCLMCVYTSLHVSERSSLNQ